MSIGFWQIVVIVLLLVVLFGRGKISALMGDLAQGIKSFKKGMQEDNQVGTPGGPAASIDLKAEPVAAKKDETVKG
ncbi:MAG: twin-arginine translocase TatA/TatE family subunit [Alphaproteobacteria bacterium]|nr:twin-arginine translocase TatA/TatE family subunit [Alphaproteobacteria bacterium]